MMDFFPFGVQIKSTDATSYFIKTATIAGQITRGLYILVQGVAADGCTIPKVYPKRLYSNGDYLVINPYKTSLFNMG